MIFDIESFDYEAKQYIIPDAKAIKFSNHYGSDGSGFGYLKFSLEREVGIRYNDVGFGYIVKIRKGLKVIYKGMIREMGESTKNGVGTITVAAIGLAKTAEDAPEIQRNFCNADLSKWKTAGEVPGALYRPDLFSASSSSGGLILTAGTQPVIANQYTELAFEFYEGEVAERIKFDFLLNLGRGVTLDADVDYGVIFIAGVLSIDDPNKYVFYKDGSNENAIAAGMTLYNVTRDISLAITAVDISLDRITVSTSPSSWITDDEIYIRDPLFSATISSIATDVITYGSDVGENNISTSSQLANITQGESTGISAFDTSANTITATDDISGWGATDVIRIVVSSISGANYLFYKNNSDETKISVDMTVVNITQALTATIEAIDAGLNRLAVSSSPSSWAVDDEIYIQGPYFTASIVTVAGSVITYTSEIGEGNLSASLDIINLTRKDVSGITSYDAGANTITATDDVSLWAANDTIIIPAPLFSATVSGVSSTQITYTGESGERVVNSDTGWVVHNTTEDEVATVASWTGPDKLDVTVAGEISSWNGDTINIYSPYRVRVKDSNNAALWPETDWRLGAVSGLTTGINVVSTGSPTTFRILFKAYIAGSGDESSFARLSNVKAYSTELDCTMETIAKAILPEMVLLGVDSTEEDIAAITKVVEPSVFEFKDIKAVLGETAKFGSQNENQVAWGIRPNDADRFFVEEFPIGVKYIIAKSRGNSDVEVSADMGESVQRIRGVYTDPLGNRVIMDWVEETDQYFGSYYISRTETLQNIDNDTDAQAYIQMLFNEQKTPPVSSSYITKGDVVQDVYGNVVPFDEVVADGSYIEVEDFRAAITGQQVSDLSANWVRDRLVAVEIDIDNKSVKLIPGKARKTFEVYMAELSRIAKL